jgi:peptidoglycan/LPS O-acetylase OafA/YrhL
MTGTPAIIGRLRAPDPPARRPPARDRYRLGLLYACGFSAGVHLALAPSHLEQSAPLGVAFAAAAVLLIALALGVFMRPGDPRPLAATTALLVSLLVAYLASRTVGLLGLEPEPEPLDAVGLLTKAIELLGLLAALRLHLDNRSRHLPLPKPRSNP